jgi:hypothetical protein
MAHINISNLSTGTESFITELQPTDTDRIIGGGYAYIGYKSNGYGEGGIVVAGYGNEGHGKGGYIAGDGEGHYQSSSYSY